MQISIYSSIIVYSFCTDLKTEWNTGVSELHQADLRQIDSVLGLGRQLGVVQLQTVDELDEQESLAVQHQQRRAVEGPGARGGCRDDPDDDGPEKEDEGQPAMVCDTPNLGGLDERYRRG